MITLVIKQTVYGRLVLWDYTERATWEGSKVFTMMGDDYAEYVPVRFERL